MIPMQQTVVCKIAHSRNTFSCQSFTFFEPVFCDFPANPYANIAKTAIYKKP